jgi:hypothetical protein
MAIMLIVIMLNVVMMSVVAPLLFVGKAGASKRQQSNGKLSLFLANNIPGWN